MKRSKKLSLVLMSATALSFTACDDAPEAGVFESVQQCLAQDGFTMQACEQNFEMAKAEHVNVAPKYLKTEDCEADFGEGRCEPAPQQTASGGSVFMPMMMGYMMGSMLGGNNRVATQPLYRSKDDPGNFRTADNAKVGGQTGIQKVDRSAAAKPAPKLRTTQRGGFGATAARMSKSASSGGFKSFGG